jgi:septal ring factor EnvC (AmiA/AmiB activator)
VTPVDITAVVGVIVTVVTSLIVPWVLRRRAARRSQDATSVASWTNLTSALQKERDALQRRLDAADAEYRAKMAALAEDHARELRDITTQLAAAQQEIRTLKAEVADLYQQLGRAHRRDA